MCKKDVIYTIGIISAQLMSHLNIIAFLFHAPFIAAFNYDLFTENVRYLNVGEVVAGLEHLLNNVTLSSKCSDDLQLLHAVVNNALTSNDTHIWTEAKRQDLLHSYTSGPYAPFG